MPLPLVGQGQRRDSLLAKVPGLVAGWLRQVTLTAHTRWPLNVISSEIVIHSPIRNQAKNRIYEN
jgi:hypothetical protein